MEIKTIPVSELLPGINVTVWCAKEEGGDIVTGPEYIMDSVQYLGENIDNIGIGIGVDVPQHLDEDVVVFHVDGRKNVVVKKRNVDEPFPYQCVVPTSWKLNEKYSHTAPATNNIRLARIDKTGKIELFRISVVSQGGEYYAVIEKTDERQICYDVMAQLVIPGLDWPALEKEIFFFGGFAPSLLPDVGDYERNLAEKSDGTDGLAENEGRVLFYNIGDGFGAVALADGRVARVNWRNIAPRGGFESAIETRRGLGCLFTDEVVTFEECVEPVQTTNRATKFQWELKGVSVKAAEEITVVE